MANMNGNDNTGLRSPETVICDSLKVIKSDKKTADSSYISNGTLQESKEIAKGYKICCLDKAEKSNNIYQDIMSFIAIGNYKKTEIIQKSIDEYIKKDDDIEKLIKDSSKLLNDMRIKIEDANNAACVMKNCITNKILPKSGKSTRDDKIVEVTDALKDIMDKTKTLNEKGQNAFESAVTIAGIQTFTNTVSLKDFSKLLTDAMKTFKDCVGTNIISTGKDVTTTREELNLIIEELTTITCNKKAEHTKSEGLDAVIKFICEGECDGECLDLCRDIKNCYDSEDESDKRWHKDKNRQSVDQN